jgi:hypothetical protein
MCGGQVGGSSALFEVAGGHPRGAVYGARHQVWLVWARCLHQWALTQPPRYRAGGLVYVAVEVWRRAVFLVVTAEHRWAAAEGIPIHARYGPPTTSNALNTPRAGAGKPATS